MFLRLHLSLQIDPESCLYKITEITLIFLGSRDCIRSWQQIFLLHFLSLSKFDFCKFCKSCSGTENKKPFTVIANQGETFFTASYAQGPKRSVCSSSSLRGTNGTNTVLPWLVRMRTIKRMSFSGFVLIERAYYPRGRTILLFTS